MWRRKKLKETHAAYIARVKAEAITKLELLVEHMREQGCLEEFRIDGDPDLKRLIWYTVSASEARRGGVLAAMKTELELAQITTAVYGRLRELRPPEVKPKVLRSKDLDAKAEEVWRRKEIHAVEPELRAYRSMLA